MSAEPIRGELIAQDETPVPVEMHPASQSASIISVIERAALNPDVDIDKMERLLQMHERIMGRDAEIAFNTAMAVMQPCLPVITARGRIVIPGKDGKEGQSTPYAKWEDVNDAIKPILAEHGFGLTFRTGLASDGKVTVTGVLTHRAGHREETTVTLTHDSSGSKNAVQAVGSSYSYGKRYSAFMLLNITVHGEDDDGKRAGAEPTITDDQADTIRELVKETKSNVKAFLDYMEAPSIPDIPAAKFRAAMASLSAKKAKVAAVAA